MQSGVKLKQKMRTAKLEVKRSSGNVFADLDVPEAEEALAKAELARRICAIISERKLTQAGTAAILGIDQPKVSALIRGKLDGYSTDRLFRFLNALGQDVDMVVRKSRQEGGRPATRVISA